MSVIWIQNGIFMMALIGSVVLYLALLARFAVGFVLFIC